MKPRPAVIPFWNEPLCLEGQVGAGQPGEDAAEDDVPVAQPDDVDADRLGGLGVLADGPGAQAPARPEQQDLEDDDEDDDRDRDRALGEEHLEDPADDRQVDQRSRAARTAGRCRRPVGEFGAMISRLR